MTDTAPKGWLGRVERLGNRLPDPATLFLLGTLLVMVLSQLAVTFDWSVTAEVPVRGADGEVRWEVKTAAVQVDGQTVRAPVVARPTSLLDGQGIYWLLSHLVQNFIGFRPLGIVLVAMLGIGIAERVGLVAVLLRLFMLNVPRRLLTPALVFIGIMSSLTTDAGYLVLPPLAALLYRAAGRAPIAGIAAALAGIGAGFNANLFITGMDPMLAELSTEGAKTIDPDYKVAATCNWWFAIASTFLITLVGWFVTARIVEPRLASTPPEDGGPDPSAEIDAAEPVDPADLRALGWATGSLVLLASLLLASILVEGWPLHGRIDPTDPDSFPRWIAHVVPILFFLFTVPSLVFGIRVGKIRSDKDGARMMVESIAAMAPIIVLAFFAGQFIECFRYSGLDRIAAFAGGQALGKAELGPALLIAAFIAITVVFNLFIGSMSAKYAMFAPVFVPMLMLGGISPELTQAAYRIGDSVSNIITPLNAYLVIVLMFMREVAPRAGMGTLIATMLPYSIVFTVAWTGLLILWMALGLDLGLAGPLWYDPAS